MQLGPAFEERLGLVHVLLASLLDDQLCQQELTAEQFLALELVAYGLKEAGLASPRNSELARFVTQSCSLSDAALLKL